MIIRAISSLSYSFLKRREASQPHFSGRTLRTVKGFESPCRSRSILIHRVAEKLKASRDEGADVQKDEEHYHYHDRHQYEVVCTHNTRPSLNLCSYTYGYAGPTYRSHPVYAASCMSIRPVLRAVTMPSAESTNLGSLDDQTRRVRVSGG